MEHLPVEVVESIDMVRGLLVAVATATVLAALLGGCGGDAEAEYMVPDVYRDMLGGYRTVIFERGDNDVEVTRLYIQIVAYTEETWTVSYRLSAVNALTYDVSITATIWWRNAGDATLTTSETPENLVRASSEGPLEGVLVIATPLAEQIDPTRTRVEWTWHRVNL